MNDGAQTEREGGTGGKRRPKLHPGISIVELKNYYWMKENLARFARRLGLPAQGSKPELSNRIERRLRGLPDLPEPDLAQGKAPRDSELPLRRSTPVGNYKSDNKTREFFQTEIGPEFHFTYFLNQYRLHHRGLTYGDLVDEWLAERDRRKSGAYKAPIAEHGKYNRFIRDFFADEKNQGKSMSDAAAAWNAVKNKRGDPAFPGG